jgi:GT2 family glycosyltransferase
MIEISIIIVSWNCRQMLAGCIKSLQAQMSADDAEIIVVDNASTDGTAQMIREEFPQVCLIASSSNLGFAEGNNRGLKVSKGRYLCLINPDVVVGEDCISRMLAFLKQHSDIGMLGPQIIGADGLVQRSCMRTPSLWNQFCRAAALDVLVKRSRLFGGYLMTDFRHDEVRDVDILNGCFWMVTREALDEVGWLDSRFWLYGDDVDWCRRFHDVAWRVVFFPQAQAVHYGGESSKQAPLFCYLQMQRADLQYWRKYHGRASYVCYWAILYFAHFLRSVSLSLVYVIHAPRRNQALQGLKKHLSCLRWLMRSVSTIDPAPVASSSTQS